METMTTFSTFGGVPRVLASALLILWLKGCTACASSGNAPALATQFADPQPVTISGYSRDAMEPFISRDGKVLLSLAN